MKQISGRDAAYLFLAENSAFSTVLSCSIIRDNGGVAAITTESAVAWMQDRIDYTDMFRSRLLRLPGDLGMPYWRHDPAFNVAEHVVIHPTHGQDWPGARRLLAEIVDRPIDMDKPLWTMHILPDIVDIPRFPGPSTIVALHFHHVAFDGATISKMIREMCTEDREYTPARPVGADTESVATLTRREIIRMPGAWFRLARGAARSRRQARHKKASGGLAHGHTRRWPATRFNKPYAGPRTFDFMSFEEAAIFALKNAVPGSTVNDVMLAIVGEGLYRYLSEIGERPQGSLSSLAPISTRGMKVASSSNQFTVMFVDLCLTEPDLRRRLELIATETKAEKARVSSEVSAVGDPVVDLLPAPLMKLMYYFSRRAAPAEPAQVPFNIVLTNVKSPPSSPRIFGRPVVAGFGVQPASNASTLAHAVANRDGQINMSITADESSMPDIARYSALIRESFDAHVAALTR